MMPRPATTREIAAIAERTKVTKSIIRLSPSFCFAMFHSAHAFERPDVWQSWVIISSSPPDPGLPSAAWTAIRSKWSWPDALCIVVYGRYRKDGTYPQHVLHQVPPDSTTPTIRDSVLLSYCTLDGFPQYWNGGKRLPAKSLVYNTDFVLLVHIRLIKQLRP